MEKYSLFLLVSLSLSGYFLRFLLNGFLANHMTPAYFGDFAITIKVLAFSAIFLLLGSNTNTMRFLSLFIRNKQTEQIRAYTIWSIRLALKSSLVLLFLFTIGVLLSYVSPLDLFKENNLVLISLIVSPLFATMLLLKSFLIANDQPNSAVILSTIVKYVVMFVLFLFAYYVLNLKLNTIVIVTVLAMTLLIITIFQVLFLGKKSDFNLNLFEAIIFGEKKQPTLNEDRKIWLNSSLVCMTNSLIFSMAMMLDLLLVKFILPNKGMTGYYAAALLVANFIWLIPTGIFLSIKPYISSGLESSDSKVELERRLKKANITSVVIVVLITAILFMFTPQILSLFGDTYIQATSSTYVLLLGSLIGALFYPSAIIIAYSEFNSWLIKITIAQQILLITLCFLLIPVYGILGAAIASTLTIITIKFIQYMFVLRKFKLNVLKFY